MKRFVLYWIQRLFGGGYVKNVTFKNCTLEGGDWKRNLKEID